MLPYNTAVAKSSAQKSVSEIWALLLTLPIPKAMSLAFGKIWKSRTKVKDPNDIPLGPVSKVLSRKNNNAIKFGLFMQKV